MVDVRCLTGFHYKALAATRLVAGGSLVGWGLRVVVWVVVGEISRLDNEAKMKVFFLLFRTQFSCRRFEPTEFPLLLACIFMRDGDSCL